MAVPGRLKIQLNSLGSVISLGGLGNECIHQDIFIYLKTEPNILRYSAQIHGNILFGGIKCRPCNLNHGRTFVLDSYPEKMGG